MRAFDADARASTGGQEHGLTFLIGAPTNLALLAAPSSAERPRDLSTPARHRHDGRAAGRGPPACATSGCSPPRIFNGYGTTEAFWNTFLRPADLPDHAGSAGPRLHRRRRRGGARLRGPTRPSPDDLRRPGRHRGRRGDRALTEVRLRLRRTSRRSRRRKLPRRLALHRRPRDLGRRRVRHDRRPQGRHDHLRRRERAPGRRSRRCSTSTPRSPTPRWSGVPDERWGELVVAYVVQTRTRARRRRAARRTAVATRCSPTTSARAPTASSTLCRVTATGKKIHYVIRDELRTGTVELVRP